MRYGIFSAISLLTGSFVLGVGIHHFIIECITTGIALLVIAFFLLIIWAIIIENNNC